MARSPPARTSAFATVDRYRRSTAGSPGQTVRRRATSKSPPMIDDAVGLTASEITRVRAPERHGYVTGDKPGSPFAAKHVVLRIGAGPRATTKRQRIRPRRTRAAAQRRLRSSSRPPRAPVGRAIRSAAPRRLRSAARVRGAAHFSRRRISAPSRSMTSSNRPGARGPRAAASRRKKPSRVSPRRRPSRLCGCSCFQTALPAHRRTLPFERLDPSIRYSSSCFRAR